LKESRCVEDGVRRKVLRGRQRGLRWLETNHWEGSATNIVVHVFVAT
jgi:hypothetical protein